MSSLMNTLYILIATTLISCGNNRNKSHEDITNEIEIIEYKESSTNIFDTVLAGGLKVTIKQNPLKSFVEQRHLQDVTTYIYRYSDFEILLNLHKNDIKIYDTVFIKNTFGLDKEFLKKAVFHNFWFKNYSSQKNEISFFGIISVPDTDWQFAFEYIVNLEDKTSRMIDRTNDE